MKLLYLSLCLLACAALAASPAYSQSGNVRKRPATNKAERAELKLSGEEFLTPNLNEIPNTPPRSTHAGVPSPKMPLYRTSPADQVVVGEVGSIVLLRSELERMAKARLMLQPKVKLMNGDITDKLRAREQDDQMQRAEDESLHEWALLKTLTTLAQNEGLTVSDKEIDAAMVAAETGGQQVGNPKDAPAGNPGKGLAVSQNEVRLEMRDALLVDKYIMKKIGETFSEEKLRQIYNSSPQRYTTPAQLHVWQIFRKMDPSLSDKEKKDLRGEFYDIRKKAARKEGRDFAELARKYSDDKDAAKTAGDMGWMPIDAIPESMVKELQKLQPGEISKIIETPTGLTIVWLQEAKQATGLTFDKDARQRVIDELIFRYKETMGEDTMRNAPFVVRLNSTGLRLVTEPSKPRQNKPLPAQAQNFDASQYEDDEAPANTNAAGAANNSAIPKPRVRDIRAEKAARDQAFNPNDYSDASRRKAPQRRVINARDMLPKVQPTEDAASGLTPSESAALVPSIAQPTASPGAQPVVSPSAQPAGQ